MPHMTLIRRFVAGLSVSFLALAGGATAQAAPIDVPWSPDSAVDADVEFLSGGVTYYGSLRPAVGERRGAALLLPGSGPIDRNGNASAANINPNTISYIADALAQRGITTLRFDKIGSGRTGTVGLDPSDPPGFSEQVDAAEVALGVLKERSGTDAPVVLGHSEGGLTALALTERTADVGALALLAPLSVRYFDLLHAQLNRNFDNAVASGQLTVGDADALRGRLDETIAALRQGRALPYPDDEVLTSVGFDAVTAKFLTEADAVDPAALAGALPSGTDVLLTCSDKDLNVSCGQTDILFEALAGTDVDYARFANASHMLGELGPLPATGLDIYAPLPQSSEFRGALDSWIDRVLA